MADEFERYVELVLQDAVDNIVGDPKGERDG